MITNETSRGMSKCLQDANHILYFGTWIKASTVRIKTTFWIHIGSSIFTDFLKACLCNFLASQSKRSWNVRVLLTWYFLEDVKTKRPYIDIIASFNDTSNSISANPVVVHQHLCMFLHLLLIFLNKKSYNLKTTRWNCMCWSLLLTVDLCCVFTYHI